MLDSDILYLRNIRDALDEIRLIVGSQTSEELIKNRSGYYGALYLLAVIGEASEKLSEALDPRALFMVLNFPCHPDRGFASGGICL